MVEHIITSEEARRRHYQVRKMPTVQGHGTKESCPFCREERPLTVKGTFKAHDFAKTPGQDKRQLGIGACAGSYLTPQAANKAAGKKAGAKRTYVIDEVRTFQVEARSAKEAAEIFDRDYNELAPDYAETTEARLA